MQKIEKLNLGSGDDIRPGYVNVDFEKFKGVDKIWDLNKIPYPFKDNQFNEIIMKNLLEHLDDAYKVMLEIHRISKKGALIHIRTPHFSSNNAWGDLQHKRGFNSETFKNSNMSDKFEILAQRITFPHIRFFMRSLAKINPVFYEKHFAYIFPAVDLVTKLRVKK
ncbi:hypothetical protein COU62_03970 [Candidatus Pacearchaeota archaeon CG10_big_fil_rev_8_21_14_0_10_35_219]|nr:class I SAM-dependent methyltransferase [Candidatus Pacearchaeota archaeon]OIO42261.1 MAG: hypothetical protein AUJ63_03215 [Candidatus Pacearchaeota archaeon CG1_02_35_32]PIO07507.1 MAG: hypothetical protein COU62_03970 [Candidatus Pacearchaeota archaeon CG10_big_fil_rev_8_21_14_0_10_35_219]PIY81314.1 MAG: hypothetical protein COY79_03465 [Candidatus Pacearchaeota archaeon CG_4_10_14_0_8_um_filter_35_169]PIZ80243.1 MAG: hypothetical protein COY00_02110 [Candidatus Pacearchaeota archaeon CG_